MICVIYLYTHYLSYLIISYVVQATLDDWASWERLADKQVVHAVPT